MINLLENIWQQLYVFFMNNVYIKLATSPMLQYVVIGYIVIFALLSITFYFRKINKKIFFIGILITGLLAIVGFANFHNEPVQYEEDETEETSSPIQNSITKAVIIKNNIEPEMLKYHHWTGTYTPTTFVITIDGKQLESGDQEVFNVKDGMLEVRFDYAFLNGRRKGAKIVSFEVNGSPNTLDMTFDWLDKWQVILDDAIGFDVDKIKFNMNLPL